MVLSNSFIKTKIGIRLAILSPIAILFVFLSGTWAQNEPNINLEQGIQYAKRHNWIKAEQLFQDAITENPSDAYAHYSLGCVYVEEGKWHAAEDELNTSLNLDSSQSKTYSALSKVYIHNKQLQLARNTLSQAIQIDPSDNWPKQMLASLNPTKNLAIKTNVVTLTKGNALENIPQTNHSTSNTVDDGMDVNSDARKEAYKHCNFALQFANNMEFDNAVKELTQAESLDPAFIPPHYDLIMLYERMGNDTGELDEANAVLKYHPNDSLALSDVKRLTEKIQNSNELNNERENLHSDTSQTYSEDKSSSNTSFTEPETNNTSNSDDKIEVAKWLGIISLFGMLVFLFFKFINYNSSNSTKNDRKDFDAKINSISSELEVKSNSTKTYGIESTAHLMAIFGSSLIILSNFCPLFMGMDLMQISEKISLMCFLSGSIGLYFSLNKNYKKLILVSLFSIGIIIYGLCKYNVPLDSIKNLQVGFVILIMGTLVLLAVSLLEISASLWDMPVGLQSLRQSKYKDIE